MNPEVIYCEFPEDVAEAAAALLKELQDEALAERDVFRVALSGGSTPELLFDLLASPEWRDEFDFSAWEVFWADERCVDPAHPDSNFRLAFDHFLSKVEIGEVFRMCGDHPDFHEAAEAYARTLKGRFMPESVVFDAILLGMGADGHTASLFPHSSVLESGALVEAVELKNNPLPHRLTLTLRVLNNARAAIFLVTGAAKALRIREVLIEQDYKLPATRVNPQEGRLIWILDEDAACELSE